MTFAMKTVNTLITAASNSSQITSTSTGSADQMSFLPHKQQWQNTIGSTVLQKVE